MVNKGGRPHLDSQHAAHKISLQGKHLAMLDEAIMATQGASADFIAAVARAKGATLEARQGAVVARRRRQFLGDLIERHCSFEALHLVEVGVVAPMMALGPTAALAAASHEVEIWQKAQSERLTAEAPTPVRAAIQHNALERLKRDDPEAYANAVADVLARVKRESAGDE